MGTYGPGEIAELVNWVQPSISVLASIGPVHLERFGDLETIVSAKSEIFSTSRTAVINIDAYGLAKEADRLQASGIEVIRCSAQDHAADVFALRRWFIGQPVGPHYRDRSSDRCSCHERSVRSSGSHIPWRL